MENIKRRVTYPDGSFIEFRDVDKDIAEAHALETGGQCARVKETYTEKEFQQEQDGGIFTTEKRMIKTEEMVDESGFVIKSMWQAVKDWFGGIFG